MCKPCFPCLSGAGALVGELTDPNLSTICPVNKPHPRLEVIGAAGSCQIGIKTVFGYALCFSLQGRQKAWATGLEFGQSTPSRAASWLRPKDDNQALHFAACSERQQQEPVRLAASA